VSKETVVNEIAKRRRSVLIAPGSDKWKARKALASTAGEGGSRP